MPHRNQSGANGFEYAYDQVNHAICAGFYFEAIAIEDAILRERLFHRCKETGLRAGRKSTTLRMIARHLRGLPADQLTANCVTFLDGLDAFISRRETCLDMLSRHGKKVPSFEPAAFNKLAQCAAVEGKELVLKVMCRSDLNGDK